MITEEALQFLADLIANNNTEWMHANKKRYENYKIGFSPDCFFTNSNCASFKAIKNDFC